MLTCFQIRQSLPKHVRQSQGPGESKNSNTTVQMALTNLKCSGFVFINDDLILKNIEHKTKCRCFFDVYGVCVKGPLPD